MPYQSTEWGWSFLCKLVRGVLRNHKKYFMYTDHCEAFCFIRCSSFVGHLGVSGQKLWLYEYGCVFVSIKILYDMRYLIYVDLRNKIKYNNFKRRSIILRLYNGICDTSHNRKRPWRKRNKFDSSWTLLFMRCCTQPELCMNKAEKMIETRQSPWTGTRSPDN